MVSVPVAAALSRFLVLSLAVISDLLLPDHAPQGALHYAFAADCRVAPLLRPFTRWDSAHFLEVAQNGWRHEWSHAFFPLYPLMTRALAALLAPFTSLCTQEAFVVAGLLLSNTAFVVAACSLHELGKHVLRDAQLAHRAALLFCVAPASIFFSSLYSESVFAAATFGGLLLLELGSPWTACLVLAAGSGCRANGLLNAPLILYHAACSSARRRRGDRRQAWPAVGEALQLVAQLASVVVGYRRLCGASTTRSGWGAAALAAEGTHEIADPSPTPTGLAATPSSWCDDRIPDAYSHVQEAYWNVGFLRYFQSRQLPNFILATPALLLCLDACRTVRAQLVWRWRDTSLSDKLLDVLRMPSMKGRTQHLKGDALSAEQAARVAVYIGQWAVLSAIAFFFSHIQITTRLVGAACAPLYWHMAILSQPPRAYKKSKRPLLKWKLEGRVLVHAHSLIYVFAGTVLHANFFPWT
ncbi:hypothetical protein AB1Y20_009941 [Prymnesium parvum]|uniref:GPI mannosyltransferase 2 n=1 Tax=Prymnesium parvum TaxID=97485 RepID=A0AB34K2A3_PRYPA